MNKHSGSIEISQNVARRFILGKQGLWPGRRWRGIVGAEHAMRAMDYLQLDPLQIIARSHDIKLYGRVLEYTPGLWEELAYQQRKFFDWGAWLAVRPMEELPHWRVVMRRERDGNARLRAIARDHADAIAEMRDILRERGEVSNRDFEMATRTRTASYRGRKDSADAYILRGIIDDWEDDEAVHILRVVRRAIRADGKLLLIERVIAPPNEGSDAKFADLNMLVIPGGRVRTREEFTAILETSGFRLMRVVSADTHCVIEAEPM